MLQLICFAGQSCVDDEEISHVLLFVYDKESFDVYHCVDVQETSDVHHFVDNEDSSDVHQSIDVEEFSDVNHSPSSQIETINGLSYYAV